MKKYYVVSINSPVKAGNIDIKITDAANARGYNYLLEIDAESYAEAVKKISFEKTVNGETRFL